MVTASIQQTQAKVIVNSFIRGVYNWMAIGLAITGFIAMYAANSQTFLQLIFNFDGTSYSPSMLFYGLIISEIGLVFYLSSRIQKISASAATALFVAYSAMNGATLSVIFLLYTASSIASTFFVCAATFTVCSVFGMITKRDLTGMGQFMFMGLIGIIIASVVNLFLQSSAMHMLISYIGVLVFVGLTAYDTQKLKVMALSQPAGLDSSSIRKGTIMGALTLYLDFINMFIFLLHIFGVNRD